MQDTPASDVFIDQFKEKTELSDFIFGCKILMTDGCVHLLESVQ